MTFRVSTRTRSAITAGMRVRVFYITIGSRKSVFPSAAFGEVVEVLDVDERSCDGTLVVRMDGGPGYYVHDRADAVELA